MPQNSKDHDCAWIRCGMRPEKYDIQDCAPLLAHLTQVPHAGGHTAEMLELVGHLDRAKYTPRTYVVASTDKLGTQKALTAEKEQHPSSSVSGHSEAACMHQSSVLPALESFFSI